MSSLAPACRLEDFQLKEWEILSGEPVFLVPRSSGNKPCDLEVSDWIQAYTYNHMPVTPELIFPCSAEEWDKYTLCLFQGKMCKAVIALGYTAELIVKNGVGYFSNNPSQDLTWETEIWC